MANITKPSLILESVATLSWCLLDTTINFAWRNHNSQFPPHMVSDHGYKWSLFQMILKLQEDDKQIPPESWTVIFITGKNKICQNFTLLKNANLALLHQEEQVEIVSFLKGWENSSSYFLIPLQNFQPPISGSSLGKNDLFHNISIWTGARTVKRNFIGVAQKKHIWLRVILMKKMKLNKKNIFVLRERVL